MDNHIFCDYFDSVVSNEIQGDILKYVFKGYADADQFIKRREYQSGVAKNAYSYQRWFEIDNNLLALNKKYFGLQVFSELNIARNSFHTLIKVENIRITMSAVENKLSLPRPAVFRNDLARWQSYFTISADKQKLEIVEQKNNSDTFIYAFIIHRPIPEEPKYPEFIRIAFPNESCTKFIDYIDLFKRFPNFVEELKHQDMIRVPDLAEVTLNIQEKKLL